MLGSGLPATKKPLSPGHFFLGKESAQLEDPQHPRSGDTLLGTPTG